MGDVHTRAPFTREDCEADILEMLARPLTLRELRSRLGMRAKFEEALEALVTSGRVKAIGARKTFDFGVEPLYQRTAGAL
jgi:hypothetical protein